MKILKYELKQVIEMGKEEIIVPGGAKPFHSQWESPDKQGSKESLAGCPVVYFGDAFGGDLINVTIKAISERQSPSAPYLRPDIEIYVGVALHPQTKELFFLFAVLSEVDALIQKEAAGEGAVLLSPEANRSKAEPVELPPEASPSNEEIWIATRKENSPP